MEKNEFKLPPPNPCDEFTTARVWRDNPELFCLYVCDVFHRLCFTCGIRHGDVSEWPLTGSIENYTALCNFLTGTFAHMGINFTGSVLYDNRASARHVISESDPSKRPKGYMTHRGYPTQRVLRHLSEDPKRSRFDERAASASEKPYIRGARVVCDLLDMEYGCMRHDVQDEQGFLRHNAVDVEVFFPRMYDRFCVRSPTTGAYVFSPPIMTDFDAIASRLLYGWSPSQSTAVATSLERTASDVSGAHAGMTGRAGLFEWLRGLKENSSMAIGSWLWRKLNPSMSGFSSSGRAGRLLEGTSNKHLERQRRVARKNRKQAAGHQRNMLNGLSTKAMSGAYLA